MTIKKIRCAICGKLKSEFGDGIKFPRTTCSDCYQHRIKQNKIDKELEKKIKKL